MATLAYSQEIPDMFEFNQSTQQAFYFFDDVLINGNLIDSNDWVGAFKGNICVGARKWDISECGGGICDVPVMGDDGTEYTDGYMTIGQTPTFKIYDSSEDEYYDANSSILICEWSNFGFCSLEELSTSYGCTNIGACNYDSSATIDDGSCEYNIDCTGTCGGIIELDCNGVCGGDATIDNCGVCNGQNQDIDCAGVCFGDSEYDCNGVCGGESAVDDCGICNGQNQDMDCAGICFGGSEYDCNGICNGNANCNINIGLNSTEFQNLVLFTNLNVQEVNGPICINANSEFYTIGLLNENQGNCIAPSNQDIIQIYISNQFYITEFNFSLTGVVLDSSPGGSNGGLAEYIGYDIIITGNQVSGQLIDTSLSALESLNLTSNCIDVLACNYEEADINDISICEYPQSYWLDIDGDGLGDELFHYELCSDEVSSQYVQNDDDICPNDPQNDQDDDGLCLEQDPYPNCNSNIVDECGICDGLGFDECGTCDGSIVDLGCGCNNAAPLDYWEDVDDDGLGSGQINTWCLSQLEDDWILFEESEEDPYPQCFYNFYDECGECGGDGIDEGTCDCSGSLPMTYCINLDGDQYGNSDENTWILLCEDEYNNYDGDGLLFASGSGLCQDENEYCSGEVDICGVCQGNEKYVDCSGECFGNHNLDINGTCCNSELIDECNVCNGNNASKDCNGDCDGDAIEDCLGICNGDAIIDDCGECNGLNNFACDNGTECFPGDGTCDEECKTPYGNCDCFGSSFDVCGSCTTDPCQVSVYFPALINNDYKNFMEIPIYLNGYTNNATGLEGMQFEFEYNSNYYDLDTIELADNLLSNGYTLVPVLPEFDDSSEYYESSINDSINQVIVLISASSETIPNFDSEYEPIVNLSFNLKSQSDGYYYPQNGYSYLHNKTTDLVFTNQFLIGNSINNSIIANDGIVQFKTIMCLDYQADNFCNNDEDETGIPSIPEDQCSYSYDENNYIISEGLCEYSIEIETGIDGSVLEDLLLETGDESFQLTIDAGTVIIADDNFSGEISFSEFYNTDILPEPTSEDGEPLILWGEVISLEPYEIIFETIDGQGVSIVIEFIPFNNRNELEYDLYKLDDLNDSIWERVDTGNDICNGSQCNVAINSFGLYSVVVGGLGCIDSGYCTVETCGYDSPISEIEACNYNEEAVVDDGSCIYPLDYWYDQDQDGFGYGNSELYCLDNLPEDWVLNSDDPEPDCANPDPQTLLIDNCGICEGINECFEHPEEFIDSWILIEKNQYSDLYCFIDDEVPAETAPFNADFINDDGDEIQEPCLTYRLELQYTEPCEWSNGTCKEIDNICSDYDNQESCEYNTYCSWFENRCIELSNNCININNQTECLNNSEYTNLAQKVCVIDESYDELISQSWIYVNEISELLEWGIGTDQICFNEYEINDYNCENYTFVEGYNELRIQSVENNKCSQDIYQRISYLSIENNEIPSKYKLYKNFPNPFNPTTNITFDIPEPNYISLDVYNLKGQHIETIVEKYMPAGNYEFMFDAKGLSSGIYFIVLKSNNFILTNKMLLLK